MARAPALLPNNDRRDDRGAWITVRQQEPRGEAGARLADVGICYCR